MTLDPACLSEETLIALADSTLPVSEREAAELHVAQCGECLKKLQWIRDHLLREFGSQTDELTLDEIRVRTGELPTLTMPPESTPLDASGDTRALDVIGRLKNYEVRRVIGRGGYGIVFEARDTILHRNVAIKVLTRDLANLPTPRRRFIREARACAAINHPNVVTIHGVEEAGDVPFIVMELIRGETLRERLQREPKLDYLDILRIGAQTAQGLAAAHAQGIIHRDVKPGNIMLVDNARVKITDFGLARVAEENIELTSRGLAVGTPAYMSPEQVRGEDLDARSDLFALGCVMYAMVTGHSPFHGRTPLDIARRIESLDPPPLSEVSPSIPEFLSSIIDRLLEKDPEDRYQSAAEVADVLNRHLALLNQTPTDRLPVVLGMKSPAATARAPSAPSKSRVWPIAVMSIGMLLASAWLYHRASDRAARGSPEHAGQSSGSGNHAATAGGAATGRSSETDLSAGTHETKSLVTVAKTGGGDFRTIREALDHVAPGGVISLTDAEQYDEPINLDQAARYAGLRIVSDNHATLRSSGGGTVMTIRGVPGVQLTGLRIVAMQRQVGIEINGTCPGTTIEDIEIRRIANDDGTLTSNAALAVRKSAQGTAETPIVIRRAALYDTNVGIVMGNPTADDAPVEHVVVEECMVGGQSRESSTLLALLRACESLVIRRNCFARGMAGCSVVAEGAAAPRQCDILRNTWYDVENWIGWTGSADSVSALRIADNLIIDSRQYLLPPLEQLAALPGVPVFAGNLAANVRGGHPPGFSPLATTTADPLVLLSVDPRDADFLKPDMDQLRKTGFLPSVIPGRHALDD